MSTLLERVTGGTLIVAIVVAFFGIGLLSSSVDSQAQTSAPSVSTSTSSNLLTIEYGDDGDYLLSVKNGKVTIRETSLVQLGDLTTPAPEPPDDPDDGDPTDPFKQLKEVVATAPQSSNEREAVSVLYTTISNLPLQEASQVRQSTSIMFNALDLGNEWASWKESVDSETADLDSSDDVKEAWKVVAEAL